MNEIIKIPIYMPKEEAELFIEFQKNFDKFKLLSNNKVFDTTAGSVTIHFDENKNIRKIETNHILFRL